QHNSNIVNSPHCAYDLNFLFVLKSGCLRCCTLFPYTTLFRSVAPRMDPSDTYRVVRATASHTGIAGSTAQGASRRSAPRPVATRDRKSTRLNSSHVASSYAVFCLKKKKLGCAQLTNSSGGGTS